MKDINEIKCFLLDMDGTIYLGDNLIEGALDFLELLKDQGKEFLFMTNNSSKNRKVYREKLSKLGCEVKEEKIFTSGEATRIYINKNKPKANVYLLGNENLEEEFIEDDFNLVNNTDIKPDYVVLGFDTTLTYNKIWSACDHIKNGTEFLATHPDYVCPLPRGKSMPDTGAMIKMFEAATGVSPKVIGKPNSLVVDSIIEKYGYDRSEIAMVGDRLYTDIKMGENAGITSILVLSGETTIEGYNKSTDIKANFVFDSVDDIKNSLGV